MKSLFQNLVLAVSGSDASIHAAKYAILMAKLYRCKLTAVYVVDTATLRQLLITKIFVEDESSEYQKNLEANGERYLGYVEELAKKKGVSIEKELRHGAIYTEILKVADERSADIIILGGWEKERSARDIISEAHKEILINAKCTVLVVKEQDIEDLYKQL